MVKSIQEAVREILRFKEAELETAYERLEVGQAIHEARQEDIALLLEEIQKYRAFLAPSAVKE